MKPEAMDEIVRETYAVHYVLWNLGIEPDDIFVSIHRVANAPLPFPYANVMVKRDGREWNMWIAPLRTDAIVRQFEAAWHEFSLRQPSLSQTERDQIIAGCGSLHQVESIRATLEQKGFRTSAWGAGVN